MIRCVNQMLEVIVHHNVGNDSFFFLFLESKQLYSRYIKTMVEFAKLPHWCNKSAFVCWCDWFEERHANSLSRDNENLYRLYKSYTLSTSCCHDHHVSSDDENQIKQYKGCCAQLLEKAKLIHSINRHIYMMWERQCK